jgi:hypothetical protein
MSAYLRTYETQTLKEAVGALRLSPILRSDLRTYETQALKVAVGALRRSPILGRTLRQNIYFQAAFTSSLRPYSA